MEIARSPRTLKAQEINALRTRIEQDDLIFKVRVVTDEIRERQQTEGEPRMRTAVAVSWRQLEAGRRFPFASILAAVPRGERRRRSNS